MPDERRDSASSNRDDSDTAPVDPIHENLVAFALGQLVEGEAESTRQSIADDPALAEEFEAIRCHLDLHAQVREIHPSTTGFGSLQNAIAADAAAEPAEPEQRGFFRRYWLSVAAAALLVAAVIFPEGLLPRDWTSESSGRPPAVADLAGTTARGSDGSVASSGVARIAYGDGVVVTLDADTTVVPIHEQRLALRAGRIFVEVAPGRRGFVVEAGEARIVTTGTKFLVHRTESGANPGGRVAVEEGAIELLVGSAKTAVLAGHEASWPGVDSAVGSAQPLAAGARIRWFEIPSMSAKILNETTIVVVLRNEMIDTIKLAPPTGGEPLFYATVGQHNYLHAPADFGKNVALEPGTEFTFEMKVRPLQDNESVTIRCPALGLEAPALRRGKD
ncbi:MAG: FecR domain-containing protein [Planctomycetota bacterium]|jgi:ferric-dicitrate binding protein FerR (iron transport regulator)